MAIAVTMRIIGMNMIPRYPRIRRESHAFALQPPELFLISERNICPRIAATMKNGKTLINAAHQAGDCFAAGLWRSSQLRRQGD
jgi:hypothetical protein